MYNKTISKDCNASHTERKLNHFNLLEIDAKIVIRLIRKMYDLRHFIVEHKIFHKDRGSWNLIKINNLIETKPFQGRALL